MSSIQKICTIKICTIKNCTKTYECKGFCNLHYKRFIAHGDPLKRLIGKHLEGVIFSTEYKAWAAMKYRCLNPSAKCYDIYGGRGIVITDRWLGVNGFTNFIADMGNKPTSKHSLDRKDNNGNYESNNCRWATTYMQNINKNRSRINTSGYIGVFWYKTWGKTAGRWVAKICIDGKSYNLGVFIDPEQAALEYDKAVVFFRGHDGVTNLI